MFRQILNNVYDRHTKESTNVYDRKRKMVSRQADICVTKDKYDRQIDELIEFRKNHGEEAFRTKINDQWGDAVGLFKKASRSMHNDAYIGCLTMIKCGFDDYESQFDDITEMIKNDPNIPRDPVEITLESLPHFAKYQREIDKRNGLSSM